MGVLFLKALQTTIRASFTLEIALQYRGGIVFGEPNIGSYMHINTP